MKICQFLVLVSLLVVAVVGNKRLKVKKRFKDKEYWRKMRIMALQKQCAVASGELYVNKGMRGVDQTYVENSIAIADYNENNNTGFTMRGKLPTSKPKRAGPKFNSKRAVSGAFVDHTCSVLVIPDPMQGKGTVRSYTWNSTDYTMVDQIQGNTTGSFLGRNLHHNTNGTTFCASEQHANVGTNGYHCYDLLSNGTFVQKGKKIVTTPSTASKVSEAMVLSNDGTELIVNRGGRNATGGFDRWTYNGTEWVANGTIAMPSEIVNAYGELKVLRIMQWNNNTDDASIDFVMVVFSGSNNATSKGGFITFEIATSTYKFTSIEKEVRAVDISDDGTKVLVQTFTQSVPNMLNYWSMVDGKVDMTGTDNTTSTSYVGDEDSLTAYGGPMFFPQSSDSFITANEDETETFVYVYGDGNVTDAPSVAPTVSPTTVAPTVAPTEKPWIEENIPLVAVGSAVIVWGLGVVAWYVYSKNVQSRALYTITPAQMGVEFN